MRGLLVPFPRFPSLRLALNLRTCPLAVSLPTSLSSVQKISKSARISRSARTHKSAPGFDRNNSNKSKKAKFARLICKITLRFVSKDYNYRGFQKTFMLRFTFIR
ncbi:hypothetical protein DVH24_030234 [Malus domestica]|uniref:Uncharacterized protein n=1 Tax=Malus domestica TaxID=3750 RepID=A0A498I369_MALDO|nr:hypothetical protein DVH24_030234 [Malus domestica]